jgi:hypothetical protein
VHTPALLVAAAMVAIGAIGMLLALSVAGLQWQASPSDVEEPEPALDLPAIPVPDRAARAAPARPKAARTGRRAPAKPPAVPGTPAVGAIPIAIPVVSAAAIPPVPNTVGPTMPSTVSPMVPSPVSPMVPSTLSATLPIGAAEPDTAGDPVSGVVAISSAAATPGAAGRADFLARRIGLRIPRPRRTARARRAQPVSTVGSAALQRHKIQLGAYALAAAERAARARAEADESMEAAARAEATRDEAWRVLEAADAKQAPAPVPAGRAAVDPAVTQAAFAAFRRGDLTVEELRRVWAQQQDNDPETAQREREQRQRLAVSRAARHAYEQAAAAARLARERATVAEVAAEALAGEAVEAAREAAGLSSV